MSTRRQTSQRGPVDTRRHPKGPRVLVTGADGFLGSHLCERLLAEGNVVWGLDNFDGSRPASRRRSNLAEALRSRRMHLVEGDIRDPVLLDGLFGDIPFDSVVHLAARTGERASLDDPVLCADVNVSGTLRVLEAMRRHEVRALVFASSAAVYGSDTPEPFRETAAADRPLTPYAASKRSAELMCHAYHRQYGLSVHCLRIFDVIGPRQPSNSFLHSLATYIARGEPLSRNGGTDARRDLVSVEDAVDGLTRSLERLSENRDGEPEFAVVNLGAGRQVRLEAIAERVGAALETEPRLVDETDPSLELQYSSLASGARAREMLGFEPALGLEEGLERFIEWFRAELDGSENRVKEEGKTPAPARAGKE